MGSRLPRGPSEAIRDERFASKTRQEEGGGGGEEEGECIGSPIGGKRVRGGSIFPRGDVWDDHLPWGKEGVGRRGREGV